MALEGMAIITLKNYDSALAAIKEKSGNFSPITSAELANRIKEIPLNSNIEFDENIFQIDSTSHINFNTNIIWLEKYKKDSPQMTRFFCSDAQDLIRKKDGTFKTAFNGFSFNFENKAQHQAYKFKINLAPEDVSVFINSCLSQDTEPFVITPTQEGWYDLSVLAKDNNYQIGEYFIQVAPKKKSPTTILITFMFE